MYKLNKSCAGPDGICLICGVGDGLEDTESCEFEGQLMDNDCPGFKCSAQCRECPKDCEFLGV